MNPPPLRYADFRICSIGAALTVTVSFTFIHLPGFVDRMNELI